MKIIRYFDKKWIAIITVLFVIVFFGFWLINNRSSADMIGGSIPVKIKAFIQYSPVYSIQDNFKNDYKDIYIRIKNERGYDEIFPTNSADLGVGGFYIPNFDFSTADRISIFLMEKINTAPNGDITYDVNKKYTPLTVGGLPFYYGSDKPEPILFANRVPIISTNPPLFGIKFTYPSQIPNYSIGEKDLIYISVFDINLIQQTNSLGVGVVDASDPKGMYSCVDVKLFTYAGYGYTSTMRTLNFKKADNIYYNYECKTDSPNRVALTPSQKNDINTNNRIGVGFEGLVTGDLYDIKINFEETNKSRTDNGQSKLECDNTAQQEQYGSPGDKSRNPYIIDSSNMCNLKYKLSNDLEKNKIYIYVKPEGASTVPVSNTSVSGYTDINISGDASATITAKEISGKGYTIYTESAKPVNCQDDCNRYSYYFNNSNTNALDEGKYEITAQLKNPAKVLQVDTDRNHFPNCDSQPTVSCKKNDYTYVININSNDFHINNLDFGELTSSQPRSRSNTKSTPSKPKKR